MSQSNSKPGGPPPPPKTIFIPRAWTAAEFQLVGVLFGITLGFGYFVICSNVTSAFITFLFASGVINATVPYYVFTVNLWAIQLNCVFQIMVSRIILIWSSPLHRKLLRWGMWAWALLLTVVVFSTWIPARLRVSNKFIAVDTVLYRITKMLCLLTNACLNFTFIFSVKKTLVANGLKKYNKVLRFNAKILALSLILDLVPILLLMCHSSLLFISFFPLSTMVKLETELVTNDLIVDVIKSELQLRVIRESHFAASPGYPTKEGIESIINTPQTCMFSDEENAKTAKIKELRSSLNLSDMWKLPPLGSTLVLTPTLQIVNSAPVGLFFHSDDQLDSSLRFGTFVPYASPVDTESDHWAHSRMSSGYSVETDIVVNSFNR
ncbi:hypothetical protein PCANC_14646 [Puccinia coronata f. sp. avenae]|uniref:Uncharacterized protein n=1 Tax=Puccinia coronata f. sp. avenae TaxID=200324 RepID=A0A2N5SVY3_9BASI|nr:hypothetical protein PCANC_14646 [Puccinia coronata f. sp. avenae]